MGPPPPFWARWGTTPSAACWWTPWPGRALETRGIRVDPTVFTTLAFVTLVDGERSFSFARKPGADTVLRFDELELSLIDQSRAFHFGALSLTDEPARSATRQAVAYARAQGKLVTFDPNYRPPLWRSEAQARAETLWGPGAGRRGQTQ